MSSNDGSGGLYTHRPTKVSSVPQKAVGSPVRLLTDTKPGLPATWYYDAAHYEQELAAIWYRDWVCIGRVEALQVAGDYFVGHIGNQSIIVTLAGDLSIRAFHNTCRHRGSVLCQQDSGRFRNGRIICPYHTWTYSTDGQLLETPRRIASDDFDVAGYSLYSVHVDTWRGFVFVNLGDNPELQLREFLGDEVDLLANWPLEDMRSVKQQTLSIACNWKIFWENYNECYHCPRVHPELCRVMPVYKQGVFDDRDVPGWEPGFDGDQGFGRVAADARTWARDGQSSLPEIPGLTDAEREMGVMFASVTASMYVVGHPDYVRSVRIVPTGPESIDLVVDWLLPDEPAVEDEQGIAAIVELVQLVIEQDGKACELNQQGLHSNRHQRGVLVPQEFEIWHFHEWLRKKLES